MTRDGFEMLLAKYVRDAKLEIFARWLRSERIRQRRILYERIYKGLKYGCLTLAVVGVVVGVYFGNAVGAAIGEISTSRSPDRELDAGAITSKSKVKRRLEAFAGKHDTELDDASATE